MLDSLLSSTQVSIMEKALSASSLRQNVISNNIANVNTPGFKKSEVAFETILQEALGGGSTIPLVKTNERHISPTLQNIDDVSPSLNTINSTSLRTDGSNVDIDIEMAELAKNNIYYDAVAQQLGKYFTNLKSVISGGK